MSVHKEPMFKRLDMVLDDFINQYSNNPEAYHLIDHHLKHIGLPEDMYNYSIEYLSKKGIEPCQTTSPIRQKNEPKQ